MITPGGEEAFVSKMIDESIGLGQRCRHVPFLISSHISLFANRFRRWYTSMVGKQSSLTVLVKLLHSHSVRILK